MKTDLRWLPLTISSETSCEKHIIAKHEDAKAAALVLGHEPELDRLTILRLGRLFQMVLEVLDPHPMLHQLRNRLSGVLLNVEFVEMMIKEAPEFGEEQIGREQRTQILTAIGHARRASGDMVELLRGASSADAHSRHVR